jgi:hypothetical protein
MTAASMTLFWERDAPDAEDGFRQFKMVLESTVFALNPGDTLNIVIKPHAA